jgi:hypothetical protein
MFSGERCDRAQAAVVGSHRICHLALRCLNRCNLSHRSVVGLSHQKCYFISVEHSGRYDTPCQEIIRRPSVLSRRVIAGERPKSPRKPPLGTNRCLRQPTVVAGFVITTKPPRLSPASGETAPLTRRHPKNQEFKPAGLSPCGQDPSRESAGRALNLVRSDVPDVARSTGVPPGRAPGPGP